MQTLLQQLGIHEEILSQEEKKFLNQNGYLNLGQVLTPEQVAALNQRIAEILEEEGGRAGWELMDSPHIRHPKEKGADRLADLVNKDPIFDQFYTHPRVLAGIAQVLGAEWKLSSLNYRAALPGYGHQNLHADWHEPIENGGYKVCNSIWLLDDFSEENGATRIVPGSHLAGRLPQDVLDEPGAPHPEQVLIEAPAGSVFIFNSHTWHGGTINRSQSPRRAIHSYFCRRDQPQQIDQSKYIRQETRDRLSAGALEVLGVL
ncbi:MAG: phytanoyl-CoA dioxygenase family protein [Bacteroidota bacterium]